MSDAVSLATANPKSGLSSLVELDQAVFDALPLGVYVCAADGRILRFNSKAMALWGRAPRVNDSSELFCGSHNLFTLDGAAIARDQTPMARAVHEAVGCQGLEAEVENPDGRRWIASVTIEPLLGADGSVVGAINCFQDVTAMRQAERAAERDRQFLRTVVETTPECIKVVARDGTLLQMNRAGAAVVGAADPDSLPGLCTFDLIAPEHRDVWEENHRRVCDGERLGWEFDILGLTGERRHMETHASPITLPSGETAHLAITRDITRRKLDEAALRESERLHRDVLQNLPAAIYTTDPEGRITFYNRAAVEFSGREPEIGSDSWCVSWRLYWPDGAPMPHDQCPMAVAMKEGQPSHGKAEAFAERPDGARRLFTPFATPLFSSAGELVGGVNMLVDITERKEAEARQKVLVDELNHRVKNTLATVQSIAAQTRREAESLDDFYPSYEDRLIALSRAHDLLTCARWEGVELRDLLGQELEAFGSERVRMDGPPVRLSPHAAVTLSMVIHELATNAAKYGALTDGSGVVEIAWRLGGAGEALSVDWAEAGGPAVAPPRKRGFGTRLVERAVSRDLGGEAVLEFAPQGLRCRIGIPLAENLASPV